MFLATDINTYGISSGGLTVTFILYYSCYHSVHLGYLYLYMTIVKLASPAIQNKDNKLVREAAWPSG